MKRNVYDRLGKRIGRAAFEPVGEVETQVEIDRETQYADLRFTPDPARAAELARRGLLGWLAAAPCLIELYSEAPGAAEFRACVGKHLAAWHRTDKSRGDGEHAPFLWILAAGAPRTLLGSFERAAGAPAGVYVMGGDLLRVGLVVASELPRDRTTLLVRIMAGGSLLAPAIRELAALPETAFERTVAEPVLLDLEHALTRDPERQRDEEDFIMVMNRSWAQERKEGRAEGRAEGQLDALRKLLKLKFGELAPEVEARLASASPDELDRYLERVLFADSLDAVLAEA